jgi:Methyltransferase domain
MSSRLKDRMYFGLGLTLGATNTVRHRIVGYRTPRPRGTDSEIHNRRVIDRWLQHIDPVGKRVLEIGPGPDLGTGDLLLTAGAASYTAVDAFRLVENVPATMAYVVTDFPGLQDLRGTFDLIVSNATLEHISDVPQLFSRLAEVSSDQCDMCHHVDAKTHMRWLKDRDPLNILRYRDSTYMCLLSFPGAPNRLRASAYIDAARRSGFGARAVPGKIADAEYLRGLRLPSRYEGDDLALLSFTLIAHRLPAGAAGSRI